jgi:hypothetical protein
MIETVVVIKPRASEERVAGPAVILLAQDRTREYLYMRGPRNALGRLLVWGAKHWPMLPPTPDYLAAVDARLAPRVSDDPEEIELMSPACKSRLADAPSGAEPDGTMDFIVRAPDRSFAFTGVRDALFFVLCDDGVMRNAAGGSGMQKQHLLELGAAMLFGADAAEAFVDDLFEGLPAGVRDMRERMRRAMRESPDADMVVTPEAAEALRGKNGDN